MKMRGFVWLSAPVLAFALVFGFLVAGIDAQTSAPSAPPAQQAPSAQQEGAPQSTPGATDRSGAPQGTTPDKATTPETRGPQAPAPPSPNVTIENRSETRSSDGQQGKFLGVDPTVALVIGAVLVVVIVIALVAMSKRSEDAPSRL